MSHSLLHMYTSLCCLSHLSVDTWVASISICCLFHLSGDTWVTSTFWISWVKILWARIYNVSSGLCCQFLEFYKRSEVIRSHATPDLTYLKSSHTGFCSDWTIIHSHQDHTRILSLPCPCQTLLFSVLMRIAIQMGVSFLKSFNNAGDKNQGLVYDRQAHVYWITSSILVIVLACIS